MNKRTPTERNTPKICPQFNSTGSCLLIAHGNKCHYAHGDMCDLCKKPFLHPYNSIKRDEHREVKYFIANYFDSNLSMKEYNILYTI